MVDQATRLGGWVKRNQRVKIPTNGQVKVNLGCGLQVAPGWVNIDGSLNALVANFPRWMHSLAYRLSGAKAFYAKDYYRDTLSKNVFIHHDLSYGIPLEDETADFVYSSHFLEHLERPVGKRLLEECLRVLKPGGVVRIAVPDLEYAWEMYKRGEKEKMIHDFFFAEEMTGFGRHRYAYDYDMLKTLLREMGFVEIRRCEFQDGKMPDLVFLDNRGDYTVFVEACRPAHAGTNTEELTT
jgi:predicted SAM-dependent methyltransferase